MMRRRARSWARIAALLGVAHAAVSAYWALGGQALLSTVGGVFQEAGRGGGTAVYLALWGVAAVKLAAVVVGLLAVERRQRALRLGGWLVACVLVAYGGVLTAVGLLVQADVIHASADANHRALAWHAYFWDPWFLLWGATLAAALVGSRPPPRPH